jgi:hypothetical protein
LNSKYQINNVDENINIDTVLTYQNHIKKEDLLREIDCYDSDDDSIEDFETVSKKN